MRSRCDRARKLAFVACAACALACGGEPAPDGPAPLDRPNLVLMIGDDQGWRDFGFMGSEIAETPNLDRLAEQSAVFPVGYVTASVCRPVLRTLLTGLDPLQFEVREARILRQTGIRWSKAGRIIERFATLPRLLAERGYASFQGGKHFEGTYEESGFTHGMNDAPGKVGRKASERLARKTMQPLYDFIDAHQEEPFFVWFAPSIPHLPHNPPPRHFETYEDLELAPFERAYFASVSWFDESAGALLSHLERRGLSERTLVLYLVDNGWDPHPYDGAPDDYLLGGAKGKTSLYEVGFRTPVLVRLPGRIEPRRLPDVLVSALDVFPTLLDYAGAPQLADRPGRSLRPVLEGRATAWRDALVGHQARLREDRGEDVRGGFFVRTLRWHYLAYASRPHELYDVIADPDEERDVAALHPKITAQARARIDAWREEILRLAAPRPETTRAATASPARDRSSASPTP